MQDDVLSINTPLALTWRTLSETVPISSLRQNNQLAFSLLEMSSELPSSAHEVHPSSPELQRIENKLNLLITLVSQLSSQSQQRRAPIPVTLSCKHLEWLSDCAPDEKAPLLLELYLDGEMQYALKIMAQVLEVTEQEGGYQVRTHFTSLSETEEQHLEKWIFVHHRRMVAQVRSRNTSF